jgi:hypothetical protein
MLNGSVRLTERGWTDSVWQWSASWPNSAVLTGQTLQCRPVKQRAANWPPNPLTWPDVRHHLISLKWNNLQSISGCRQHQGKSNHWNKCTFLGTKVPCTLRWPVGLLHFSILFWFHFVSLYIWSYALSDSFWFCKLCILILIFLQLRSG